MSNVLEKMQIAEDNFNKIKNTIDVRLKEVQALEDEGKRFQGEYRVLRQIALEDGLINEEGNIIEKVDDDNGTDAETKQE